MPKLSEEEVLVGTLEVRHDLTDNEKKAVKKILSSRSRMRRDRNRAVELLDALMNDNSLLRTNRFRTRVEALIAESRDGDA